MKPRFFAELAFMPVQRQEFEVNVDVETEEGCFSFLVLTMDLKASKLFIDNILWS